MKTWITENPTKKSGYICRMKNRYIKMCYWNGEKWLDMWKTTLKGEVIEWMKIPYNFHFVPIEIVKIDEGEIKPQENIK